MSMNPEQDDFRNLRRLLALKRYEQPPPRYFSDFSRQVINRIQAGERLEADSWLERLGWEAPWLQKLLNLMDARPIMAGVFGAAVCGVLLAGIVYSEQSVSPAPALVAFQPVAEDRSTLTAQLENRPVGPLLEPVATSAAFDNAASSDGASLFQQFKALQNARGKPEPASLKLSPNPGN